MCLILGYGGYLVYIDTDNTFTIGKLIEFMSYFGSCIWPMMAISMLVDLSSRGKASLNRISEFLDYKNNIFDKDVIDVDFIKGDIEFRNLTFKYPDSNEEVLKNISFKIKHGENIGVIGKTGCGKTTLVDLLLRLYNVEDNTIFIDDIDINRIPIKTLRKYSSYVPQDNFLFSDTIESNIAFAYEYVNKDDVIKASKLADVHDNIIGFEKGYETILGERGVTISGGQKQRTSIARALMKDASILILDDSVSAVDTKTDKLIRKAFKEEIPNTTKIIIAQRIASVEDVDKIIVFENGEINGFGTHEELLKTNAIYKEVYDSQVKGGEENE